MLYFEEYQASVPQQPGNIYGSLVLCKVGFSHSYGSMTEYQEATFPSKMVTTISSEYGA